MCCRSISRNIMFIIILTIVQLILSVASTIKSLVDRDSNELGACYSVIVFVSITCTIKFIESMFSVIAQITKKYSVDNNPDDTSMCNLVSAIVHMCGSLATTIWGIYVNSGMNSCQSYIKNIDFNVIVVSIIVTAISIYVLVLSFLSLVVEILYVRNRLHNLTNSYIIQPDQPYVAINTV